MICSAWLKARTEELLIIAAFAMLPVCSLRAQQPDNPASAPPAGAGAPVQPAPKPPEPAKSAPPSGTSNDRLLFALPNFLTLEDVGKVPPLTAGQKFKAVARGAFDKIEYPWYGMLAGISQAENSEPGYGQGAEGYAKRYGAAFADGTIENFMTSAVMASILKQDPRFYQSSHGSALHRLGYAMSRILITRGDSGNPQFNFSEIFGSAIAASASTYSYHPEADRTVSNTAKVWGTEVGYDTLTLVVKEFWPDLRKKLVRKHATTPAGQQ